MFETHIGGSENPNGMTLTFQKIYIS